MSAARSINVDVDGKTEVRTVAHRYASNAAGRLLVPLCKGRVYP